MITEALLHCSGIGPARLAMLHARGIRTWSDALGQVDQIPGTVRDRVVEECQRCVEAHEQRDVRYFVEHFAAADKWRILTEFLDDATFFDIETTGLEYDAGITVIGCRHRGRMHTFVEHENLDEFLALLDEVTLLASFNGSSFDVPRVLDTFHIPELPCPHLDLRWPCYHVGMRGTLKQIAHRGGIGRPADLADSDGLVAVHLWNRWILAQDRAARDQLLRYCAADVLILWAVASQLAGRGEPGPAELWSHLPTADTTASSAPVTFDTSRSHHGRFGDASPTRLRARLPRAAG